MTQVTDFSAEEVAFGWLQFQAMLHESFQHGMEVHQVFLLGLGVNDHVVQVYQGIREVQLPQAVLHEMLEHHWSIAQPIGHAQELVHAHATHHEGSVLPRLLIHLNLPKPALQVHAREVSGAHHAFHGVLHTWQGIGVLFGPGIQAAKDDTEPERPILFSHEHNGVAPGQLGGSDGIAI